MLGYDHFIATVRDRAGVPADEAERTACATLKTLAQRITPGEVRHVAQRLPEPLRECAAPDGPPERFHVDEFLHRVAERAGIEQGAAERDARAVFTALLEAVGAEEFGDLRAQLPKDFDGLLDAAVAQASPRLPSAPLFGYDEFVRRVAERGGDDRETAATMADAVLEALAERVAGGQVLDLERLLPYELRPALERGRERTGGRAVPSPVDRFVREVARIADSDKGAAAKYARAVLLTLREEAGVIEFNHTLDQLPGEYRTLVR